MKKVKSLLDYFAGYTKRIVIKCNDEEIITADDKIKLLSDHAHILNKELDKFDIDNDTLIIYIKE